MINADYNINALSFTAPAGNYNITNSGGGAPGRLLTLQSGISNLNGGSHSIDARMAFGNAQTWLLEGGTLTLGATGQNRSIANNGHTLTINGTGNALFNSQFTGSGGLIHNSSGTTTLSFGGNTTLSSYTGTTQVNNGTLILDMGDTGNETPLTGAITVGGTGNNALLATRFFDQIGDNTMVNVLQGGTLQINDETWVAAINETLGGLNLSSGATVTTAPASSVVLNGNVTRDAAGTSSALIEGNLGLGSASRTFTVNNSGATDDLVIDAVISGGASSDVTFNGSGATVLNGANTFSGNLILNQGTVRVSADNNLGANSNTVRFTGGTLNITDTFTTNANRTFEFAAGGGTIDVDAGEILSVTAANRLVGSGSLSKVGEGTLRVTNSTQTFSGGLIVNEGTYLADLTGNVTIGQVSNNSALGSGAVTVDGANALLHVNTTGNIAYNRNTSIDNGGTVRLSPGTPNSNRITSLGGRFTFGSGGGVLDLDGFVGPTGLFLTTNANAATPAIVRTSTWTNDSGQGGWPTDSTLRLNGGLDAGSVDNVVRFEVTNGALVEQADGQLNYNGTLEISGQPGGDPSVGSYSTNVGRWALIRDGTYSYDGGIFFENVVQFTIFNGPRTVDADLTVRDGGRVAFQGRSTAQSVQEPLTLGVSPNQNTLLVQSGGEAILDIRYRADNSINTGGVILNNRTVLEDNANLRFTWSNTDLSDGGVASRHTVNGDIVGEGFGSTRATDARVIIDDSINSGTGVGGVDWSDSMNLVVNGSDCNGLRLEGNLGNLQNLLRVGSTDNARLDGVTGSGGVLTIALNNSSAQNLTIDRAPTSGSEVGLGFDVAPGGTQANTYTLGTTANDLANWNGLAVKGGTVQMAVNQSFTGGTTDSTLCLLGGTLNLGDDSTPRTLTIQGDATLAGGTLSGGTQAGAKGTLVSSGGDFINNGTTFANTPNLTSTTDGSSSLTGSQGFTGIGTLTMAGTGTLTLVQTVEAQTIEVSSGTLVLGGSNRISDSTNIVLSGGTFAANGFSDEMGTLTLTENSVIDFGGGDSILRFADSSGESWNPDATLTIVNWGGEPIVGGGLDRLFVGTSGGGLTSGQLSQIKFAEYPNFSVTQLPDGEVVPVPEPATIIAGIGLLGFFVWRERDRLIRRWRSVRGKHST